MIDKSIILPGWFEEPGAYVLVDGQFGSTGKGLLAGFLAEYGEGKITHVTTNAGPNSGHTAYFDFWGTAKPNPELGEQGYEKIVTQQMPVASVFLNRLGPKAKTFINAGAVIDTEILLDEYGKYGFRPEDISIHPNAVVIGDADRYNDASVVASIAGTGKGVGPAIARKIGRKMGGMASDVYHPQLPGNQPHRSWDAFWDWSTDVVFVETAQGFSLGINSSRFYPNVTSRECTVAQAIADARIPAGRVQKSVACFRTFPIRVGNTATGHSGDCYEDQQETTWEAIGQPAEITTVTKRVRRVFTWSRIQFMECIAVNEPEVVFINFMNYLPEVGQAQLLRQIVNDYRIAIGRYPQAVLGGYGPYSTDIRRIY